ncbi:MAG: aminoacyl--tRNA ligase-related protein [Planctomycetaceae bacterium]
MANSDLSLVATAEITLGGIQKDQILDVATLPLKYAGLSHCFRTEAGAAGRAGRGIYRVHQFTKVEMFGYTGPDLKDSDILHAEILRIEEEVFQALGIPYRVIDTASGDLGGPAYRKFDIEAWMPGRGDGGEYGEVKCLKLHGLSGTPFEHPLQEPGQEGHSVCPDIEWHGNFVHERLSLFWKTTSRPTVVSLCRKCLRPWLARTLTKS